MAAVTVGRIAVLRAAPEGGGLFEVAVDVGAALHDRIGGQIEKSGFVIGPMGWMGRIVDVGRHVDEVVHVGRGETGTAGVAFFASCLRRD